IVVAEGGRVVEELPLPVAGLMSDQPLADGYQRLRSMEKRLAGLGMTMAAPFMTLSFLALSVIPELKITDRGLVDVARFELVPLAVALRPRRFQRAACRGGRTPPARLLLPPGLGIGRRRGQA